jgi:mannose-1-phosphate guanylyltransferase
MEPEVIEHIPSDVPFGFDDLALGMLARDIPIRTFRHNGMWLDIGRVEDFQKAQELNWDEERPAFEMVAAA